MTPGGSPTAFWGDLQRVFSATRLESYQRQGQTPEQAICIYLWNVKLCEALYPSLQMLEVGFRNALHAEVGAAIKSPEWLKAEHAILFSEEREKIASAKQSLIARRKQITEAYLVAEMNFGFWTSLLDVRYDRLWHKIIAGVFPGMPRSLRTRGEASAVINRIRRLRNAALHHHSIWHWHDLREHHMRICEVLGWIGVSLAEVSKHIDDFPRVYIDGPEAYLTRVREFGRQASPRSP